MPSRVGNPVCRGRPRIGHFFVCLAAFVSALVALGLPSASSAATPARPADSFVESIGVNTHFYYSDTPYVQRFEVVKQRLAELGVRHIRENIAPDERPDQYQRLRELASGGIRADLILGEPSNGITTLDRMLSTVRTELPGAVEAVEGPNEYDARGVANWQQQLREYQEHLYTSVKSDPSLSSLTVVAPSIVRLANEQQLGDLSGTVDIGNVHSYTDGKPPETNAAEYLERARLNAPGKLAYATEDGYNTALRSGEGLSPVSEAAMATYTPRIFLENFRLGFARTYCYELLDEFPDPELTHPESNFGLLRNDLSPKPAFEALRNLIAILSDPGPAFSPEALDYTISGERGALRRVLLEKRDGSFYLVLWRATSVWDPARGAPVQDPAQPITLSFERRLESALRYQPGVSASPVALRPTSGGHQLSLDVGPEVVILKLNLGGPKSARVKAWISRRTAATGSRVSVRGHVPQTPGRKLRITVQEWKRGWHSVGAGFTSPSGAFKEAIRLSRRRSGSTLRLRVVAPHARPSRAIRVRLRDAQPIRRAEVGSAKAVLEIG